MSWSRLGRRSLWRRSADRVTRASPRELEKAGGEWHVTFLPDPDEELEEGGVLVYSELKLPAKPELGSGERTRRITTVHTSHGTTVREQNITCRAQVAAKRFSRASNTSTIRVRMLTTS